MIKQRRNHVMAIWLGLFAMLMIHVGPLISATQALLLDDAVTMQAPSAPVLGHAHAEHHAVESSVAEPVVPDHGVDYHALMGHHVPDGAPQWLANLEMCGYCDLLTVSPPLILTFVLALPVLPALQWLVVLPTAPKPLTAAHSIGHPRAPPVQLFA